MDEDPGKSGEYDPVARVERKALHLLTTGMILVSLGGVLMGAAALGVGNLKIVAGATLSLLGGAMAFAAAVHLRGRV